MFINKNVFLCHISKNLNQEILTKNLVTFKRWDGVNNEKFDYYLGSLKNPTFRGGIHEKPIYMEEFSKKGPFPLPHSCGRFTCYSNKLLHFPVTIPRFYEVVSVNTFFPHVASS